MIALKEALKGFGEVGYDDLEYFLLLEGLAFEVGVDVQALHDVLDLAIEGATLKLISSRTEN